MILAIYYVFRKRRFHALTSENNLCEFGYNFVCLFHCFVYVSIYLYLCVWTSIILCTVEPLLWGHPFCIRKVGFKWGGLSSGVEINTFMFRFTLSSGLSREGGLLSGWPLKRGSTVYARLAEYNAKKNSEVREQVHSWQLTIRKIVVHFL